MNVYLSNIVSIETLVRHCSRFHGVAEREVHLPVHHPREDTDTLLAADDETARLYNYALRITRRDWIHRIASLTVLQMAFTGDINEERFK